MYLVKSHRETRSLSATAYRVAAPPRQQARFLLHSADSEREAAGAGPEVIRLSVGLELAEDLMRDLDEALRT